MTEGLSSPRQGEALDAQTRPRSRVAGTLGGRRAAHACVSPRLREAKPGLPCSSAASCQRELGSPSSSGSPHTSVLPSQNATQQFRRRGVRPSRRGPAWDAGSPGAATGSGKATRQSGRRKPRAWGAQPSPTSLLGPGTARPLPGYGASSLHQQIVRIPFPQELPRAPKKGEAKTGPGQGRSSPWGVLAPREAEERLGDSCPRPGPLPWPFPHLENGSGGQSAPANPTEMSCQ